MIQNLRKALCVLAMLLASSTGLISDEADVYEIDVDELRTEAQISNAMGQFLRHTELRPLADQCECCFHHLTDAELRRLHTSLKPTRSEFRAIEAELQLAIRRATLHIYQDHLSRIQLRNAGWPAGNQRGNFAPITIVEDALLRISQDQLGEARCNKYRAEILACRTYRRAAIADAIVASLDSQLSLTSDQRDRISNVLLQEWEDGWLLSIPRLLVGGIETMPLLPKTEIRKHLSMPQQTVLENMPWKFSPIPAIGPIELTLLPRDSKRSKLVEELQFPTTNQGIETE